VAEAHLIRYGTYLVGIPAFSPQCDQFLVLAAVCHRRSVVPEAALSTVDPHAAQPKSIRICAAQGHRMGAVIRVTGDIAKMIGYPIGIAWRIQHKQRS